MDSTFAQLVDPKNPAYKSGPGTSFAGEFLASLDWYFWVLLLVGLLVPLLFLAVVIGVVFWLRRRRGRVT